MKDDDSSDDAQRAQRLSRRRLQRELEAWSDAAGQLPAARRRLVVTAVTGRRRARAGGAGALLAVGLATAVWALFVRPLRYTVDDGAGAGAAPRLEGHATEASPASGRMAIVEAPSQGRRMVRFDDGATLALHPAGELGIAESPRRAPRIELLRGAVRAKLPSSVLRTWTFGAGAFSVAVGGAAELQLSFREDEEAISVDVERGVVIITASCLGAPRRLEGPGEARLSCTPAADARAVPRLASAAPASGSEAPRAATGPVDAEERDVRPVVSALRAEGSPVDQGDPDLVGHWTFDDPPKSERARDLSGHGNDAILNPTRGRLELVPGRSGGALALYGDATALVPASRSLDSATRALTISAWVYRTDDGLKFDMIASRQAKGTNGEHFGFGCLNNQLMLLVETQPPEITVRDWGLVPNHRWVHVAGTWDGESAVVFLNGVEVARRPRSGRVAASGTPLVIGANENIPGLSEWFRGQIDDLRLYRRALRADEIAALAAP